MDFLNLLPILITAVGAYFLFKLRFFIFTNPKGIIKKLGSDCVSSASSLSLALAGTLGVGNIVGVAVGISVGGAGSVFWLLVSAVFASVIKFAEVILTADRGAGLGMIGAVGASFGVLSRPLSLVYAALVILLSFSMGSMLQSASIGQSTEYVLNFPPVFTALVLLLLLVFAVFFFSGKIERITVVLIPVATAVYVFLCLSAILLNLERLPSVIFNIFRCAFDFESGVGGVIGFLCSAKIREGYLRGLISNEAGAGTSSLAHAKNPTSDVGSVGIMGMCEVLFDTVILCILTALATLVSIPNAIGMEGMRAVMEGVGSVFGDVSEICVALCIFAFAYSTMICWYYYGGCAFRYIFGGGDLVFSVLFISFAVLGVFCRGDFLITVSDVILFFLSLISLSALMISSDRIKALSELSGLVKPPRQCRARRASIRLKCIQGDQPKRRKP